MIYDNKQMFFDGETITSNLVSVIVPNFMENETTTKQQNAGKQLYLYAKSTGATGDTNLKFETAEDFAFTSGVKVLGEYVMTSTDPVKVRVPIGSLGYYRLTAAGSNGTIKSGLVVDVDME